MFDITDDKTGSIHDIAKEHVPIYVNEVNAGGVPCVKAEHDPEGFVHYLIGHRYAEEGPFHLTADGKEMEILIDYGEGYENVR